MSDQLDLIPLPKTRPPKTKLAGHAWAPGSGPKGETCGSCEHLTRKRMARTYLKCWLMRDRWSNGPNSDVKMADAACRKWKSKGRLPP